jgi:phage terminase small subunit
LTEPTPLRGLSRRGRALYRQVADDFELQAHHLRLLEMLCQAIDRADKAQELLDAEGLLIVDRFGQQRPLPAVAIRRDAEVTVARLLRELDLDAEVVSEIRPPRIAGRYA